jgi:spore coat-associated protein N
VLAEHPRRSIIALASALAAVAVAIGSGATFTSSSANPSNTFSAGILSQSNSDSNAAILTASNMIPGSSASGTVTITNTGTVNGAFSLSESDITDTPGPNGGKLSGDLQLTVTNVTNSSSPVTVYSGALNAMPTEALGTIAPGSCQWPFFSPQVRPCFLPSRGHVFSPLVAIFSPHHMGLPLAV